MRNQNYDYGDKNWKEKQITWQKPQVWTHKDYKFYMYQSSNGFLNWRCLKAYRPDGSLFDNMSYGFKKNIGKTAESTKQYLREQVAWDILPQKEKDRITNQPKYLF
jgi:hypothetical protein